MGTFLLTAQGDIIKNAQQAREGGAKGRAKGAEAARGVASGDASETCYLELCGTFCASGFHRSAAC
jgi:hypothetical protein